MKVKKITVQNLKALEKMEADFNGCTAIITGGNNKGKSSFLKSLPERLQGEKPTEVLKKGETEGKAERELTDGSRFIRTFDDNKEKLSYITKEGIEIKTGVIKELGKKFFGERFDIDEFLNSQPKKQKEVLQKLVGIDLSKIEEEYKQAYDERTAKNTIYKNMKAMTDGVCETIFEIEGGKVDLSDLQNKLIEAEKANQNYDYVLKGIEDKKAQSEEIKKQIKELQEKQLKIIEDLEKGELYIKNNKKVETEDIRKQIEDGKKKNELIDANEQAKKQIENVKKTEEERKQSDLRVKEIESKKLELIKSCKLPEGFEFTDDGIKYNGYELDKKQLSSSSIYIASLKLASMVVGEIKTICFDASYLDNNSLKEVEKRANENGLQLLIERPDYDGGDIEYQILSNNL